MQPFSFQRVLYTREQSSTAMMNERRQKRTHKTARDKYILRLHRRNTSLWKAYRDRGMIELEKPIRSGFKKFWVLRQDIARRKDAPLIQKLLDRMNTVVYSSDRRFINRHRKKKRQEPLQPQLLNLRVDEWNKLTAEEKRFFYLKRNRHKELVYKFTDTWFFVEKTEPYYITHLQIVAPDIQSEMRWIDNRFARFNLERRLDKLMNRIPRAREHRIETLPGRLRAEKRYINRMIQQELDEFYDAGAQCA